MKLSTVIVTHNRREALLTTLAKLHANPHVPTDAGDGEILLVDNASTDGTPEAVRERFPHVTIIERPTNEGVSARNYAFRVARGESIMLVDDDSYPIGDAASRAMSYLDDNPHVGAVVGRVELPDGRLESSALPTVMINCAVVLRTAALDRVGYLPIEFFRQAEEYDLSMRLWADGSRIERFEDLRFAHNKAAGNRPSAEMHRLDVRNNLILIERYFPVLLRKVYRADWMQRYSGFASTPEHRAATRKGYRQGRSWALREWWAGRRTMPPEAFEQVWQLQHQRDRIGAWSKEHRIRRVVIADFAKNLWATHRGCLDTGLDVIAISEKNPAFIGSAYRGTPFIDEATRPWNYADGLVLSTVMPATMQHRLKELQAACDKPILHLWEPKTLGQATQSMPSTTQQPIAIAA